MKLGRDFNPDSYKYYFDEARHKTNAEIISLARACSESPFLLGLHMSDNGLREDKELLLEVLDMFGLNEESLKSYEDFEYKVNRRVYKTNILRNAIKQYTGATTLKEMEE